MPKSRGDSIASSGSRSTGGAAGSINQNGGAGEEVNSTRSTIGVNGINEIVERVNTRLQSSRTVTVPAYSNTRRREENMQVTYNEDGRHAQVSSASGHTYDVDYLDNTCNCIHFRTRGGVGCRHIDAVNRGLGQISQQPVNTPTTGNSSFTQEHQAARTLADQQAEASRNTINQDISDDGFFYSDNEQEFLNALQAARNIEPEYEYENALNGSQNTFGLEIEFVGGDANAIARELHALGICAYNTRVGYHSRSVPGKWKLESDGSVSSGSQGGELVSPVLKDTPETWHTIEKICEVARRHGATIDNRCGGHVHVGMDSLDTAKQRWKRFMKTIGSFEDVIYRLAGGSMGRIRSGYTHYATPFASTAQSAANRNFQMESAADVNNFARSICTNRYNSINLTNIPNPSRPNTVEFRYFNSSLDPRQLQANVKIANAIMVASEKARTRNSSDSIVSDTMKKRGNMLKEQTPGRNRDNNALMKFVDIVFSRKSDKDRIINVFAKNTWAN